MASEQLLIDDSNKISRQQGREEGLAEGLEKGREKGLAEGLEKGREEGLAEGLEQGRAEVRRETARRLRDMGLPPEQVARGSGLTMDELQQL